MGRGEAGGGGEGLYFCGFLCFCLLQFVGGGTERGDRLLTGFRVVSSGELGFCTGEFVPSCSSVEVYGMAAAPAMQLTDIVGGK